MKKVLKIKIFIDNQNNYEIQKKTAKISKSV